MYALREWQRLVGCITIALIGGPAALGADDFTFDPQVSQIWERLERLEQQNQELARQNARLRRMVEATAAAASCQAQEKPAPPPLHPPGNGCCCPDCGLHSCECPRQAAPCFECPHVSTLAPYWNLSIFGALVADMMYHTSRPIAPGTPFLLGPGSPFGFDTDTFDLNGRQSTLGAALAGPEICGLRAGGLVLVCFYNDTIIADRYGVLPLQAWGELKNDDMRFSAGLQFDVFCPSIPTVLPFSVLLGSGNGGNDFRGQVRWERYLRPASDSQWTLQLALSEPIATSITDDFTLTEDNGWPNLEGRLLYGFGPEEQLGLDKRRPLEIGLSGVAGQVRRTSPAPVPMQVVSDVWGVGLDFRFKLTERFGFQGELIQGQGLGTYNAGILQILNAERFNAIRTSGGWLEMWYYWTPCFHSHFGYAIDDPLDRDLATTDPLLFSPVRNETWFLNWLWDVTPNFRAGFELTWRSTAYDKVPDAEGAGFHTQFRWSF
jgi:hypothetical protein